MGMMTSSTSVASEVGGGTPLSAIVENIATLLVRREEEAALKALTDATVRERINERRMLDYNSKEGVSRATVSHYCFRSSRRKENQKQSLDE